MRRKEEKEEGEGRRIMGEREIMNDVKEEG